MKPKADFDYLLHKLVNEAWESLETVSGTAWYCQMRERFDEVPGLRERFDRMESVRRTRRLNDEEFAKYRKVRDEIAKIEKGPQAWDKVMSYVHWQARGGTTNSRYSKVKDLPDPDDTVFDEPSEEKGLDFELFIDE